MRPLLLALVFISSSCRGSAKPSEEDCRRVARHLTSLSEGHASQRSADTERLVRGCRAMSSKKTVDCILSADSVKELSKCENDVEPNLTDPSKPAQTAPAQMTPEKAPKQQK